MYKQCFSEQSANRQHELEHGLLRAMCIERYEDITVSNLCEQMNIPRKCFYRYFSGKDGALFALIDHTLMELTGEFYSETMATTIPTLERFFQFWKEKRLLLDALTKSEMTGVLIQRSIVRAVAEDLLPARNFYHHRHIPLDYIINFLISGLLSLVIQWHQSDFRESESDLAFAAALLLTQPLFSRAPTSETSEKRML